MKKYNKIKKAILAITISVLLTGCAVFHGGTMNSSGALSSANFFYAKRNIKGEAEVKYLFGIGGFKTETLVNDAKAALLYDNPIKDNQALVNLTVNFKKSFILFGIITYVKCIIVADVVEFREPEKDPVEKK